MRHEERLSDWTPPLAILANIEDILRSLIAVTIKVAGGKPPAVHPHPRPITAAQRARERRRYQDHEELVARMLAR